MSAVEVLSTVDQPLPSLELAAEMYVESPSLDEFDPTQHLNFKQPSKTYTMKDLKLPEDTGVSPFAVSEPFPLFTEAAVQRMRAEIFKPEVMDHYQYSSNLAQCQLRGFAAKAAPFIYDVWRHPETLAIISKIAGVELVPEMDFEIGHINLSTKSDKQKAEELAAVRDRQLTEADEGIAGCPWEDDKPIVDWHTDSYPFVCVTMLSDCSTMIGGETALRTGDGNIVKIRGPDKGHAIVLQGRHIEHQALRALGSTERITSVTSFRPKDYSLRDDTVLTTVRPISNLSELYAQYSEYRLEMLEERVRDRLRSLRETVKAGKKMNTLAMKAFLREQELFLAHMNQQLIEDSLVTKGCIDDSHLFSEFSRKGQPKRSG